MGKKLFKKKEWDLKTFDGDILLNERADRRVLPDVPDPEESAPSLTGAVYLRIMTVSNPSF